MSNRRLASGVASAMVPRLALALIAGLLVILPAQGEDPPLPRPRPESAAPSVAPVVPLPRPRPETPSSAPDTAPADAADAPAEHEPAASEAPARIYQTACPAVLTGLVEAKSLPPLSEGESQCGSVSPLSVTGVLVNGRMVPVAGGVVTDCGMASTLPGWLADIDGYLKAREKTQIAELVVGTSYMCRNVNNATSGNLSFHGLADALDVVGFRLEDGRFVTVEAGWADAASDAGRLLRFAHDAACARFTTTLGPEANAAHRDHFHIDLGCHGKTCTARLCE